MTCSSPGTVHLCHICPGLAVTSCHRFPVLTSHTSWSRGTSTGTMHHHCIRHHYFNGADQYFHNQGVYILVLCASTKQNYIVKIRIHLPKLCHQNYCRVTTKHIENNQSIIYVNNPDKKQDGR